MNRPAAILVDDEDVRPRLPGDDRPFLIKLCGDVARPPRPVVSRSEYQAMPDAGRNQLFLLVNEWLTTGTVLAIGCDQSQGQ